MRCNGPLTPGDFDFDGDVDADDYELWSSGAPQADAQIDTIANGVLNDDPEAGVVDEDDYAVWAANVDGIIVSTLTDESDSDYSYGDLSLREALLLAADGSHPGSDIIAFDESLFGGTITINPSLGTLNVGNTNEVEILGPGADQLTLDANGIATLFNFLSGGGTPIESTIANLTLTGTSTSGKAISQGSSANHDLVLDKVSIVDNGWGIMPGGNSDLTISNSTISNNYWDGIGRTSQSTNPTSGTLTIVNSKILDNGRDGIYLRSVDTDIYTTEIAGNASGGINYESEETYTTLTITDSTIAENDGPGIAIGTDADANIRNTTISSNNGVGMSVASATATLTNVTITQNRVANSSDTAAPACMPIATARSSCTTRLSPTITPEREGRRCWPIWERRLPVRSPSAPVLIIWSESSATAALPRHRATSSWAPAAILD